MSTSDFAALVREPRYYLSGVDLDRGECIFQQVDRDTYKRSTFLDHRIRAATDATQRVPLDVMLGLTQSLNGQGSRTHYIWHSAFCCSTLLAKSLDFDERCCVLREPSALMQLANYKRTGHGWLVNEERWRELVDAVLAVLGKSWQPGEEVVIKPTNAANNIAVDVIRNPRTGAMLLLYSSLERFLVSILRKGEAGRAYVRTLFSIIMSDSPRVQSITPRRLIQLTDLQMAALAWYLQLDNFVQLMRDCPAARIRTLDSDVLLAEPLATLKKLCAFFGIAVSDAALEEVVTGPVFTKYSKDEAQDYDAAVRDAEFEQSLREHRRTIEGIVAWSEQIRPEGPLRLPLPNAL